MGFSIAAQAIEHWQLWNDLPTATSSVFLHEIHSGCHLQHVNHPPVGTESEPSRRNLSPGAMKARTLASGAPSETTHSLQFPTHTFNLLALMQMLLRAERAPTLPLHELTCLSKQSRNFISLLCTVGVSSQWRWNKYLSPVFLFFFSLYLVIKILNRESDKLSCLPLDYATEYWSVTWVDLLQYALLLHWTYKCNYIRSQLFSKAPGWKRGCM